MATRNKLNKLLVAFVLLHTVYQGSSQETEPPPPIRNLDGIYSWKTLEFGFPTEYDREYAIQSGLYVEGEGIPFDVDTYYNTDYSREVFMTSPKGIGTTIPYTLSVVTNEMGPKGPILQPFPDYQTHLRQDCDGITSAMTIAITECNQLYVLDNGIVSNATVCPPQILIYDIQSRELLNRYRFPKKTYIPNLSFFVSMKVDVLNDSPNGNCWDSMVYVSDTRANNLVVYDVRKGDSWIVSSRWMYPEPEYARISVANKSYLNMGGLFSLSLEPKTTENRRLIFNVFNGVNKYAIALDKLNDKSIWKNPKNFPNDEDFEVLLGFRIQPPASAIDQFGFMYGVYYDTLSLSMWNTSLPRVAENFIRRIYNPVTLQFGSSVKLVKRPSSDAEELWVLTNRYNWRFKYNKKDTNFRIMACTTQQLREFRQCRVRL